jgi:DNA repair protein RecO (recombination protein O)
MAELRDEALLLRRIPYGDTSLICHFLTEQHGRITLMVRGAKRPKSPFRASLEPLYALQISWRPGRSGMGGLADIQRGQSLLEPSLSLDGLELLAIVSRLFQEGDPHGFEETHAALKLLGERKEHNLLVAVWHLLDAAGWLGDLLHCWKCGKEAEQAMFWQQAHLVCESCGGGMTVSAGLRKSIAGILSGNHIRLSAGDADTWREMVRSVLKEHGIKATDSFKG